MRLFRAPILNSLLFCSYALLTFSGNKFFGCADIAEATIILAYTQYTRKEVSSASKVKKKIFLSYKTLIVKDTQAWDIFEFFLPKSNPSMPLVNFRKKFCLVSFDFCQNFEVQTFTRWLSIRGTQFFLRDIQKNFFSKIFTMVLFRWVPRRFLQILIFYSQNLHFN